MNNLLPGDSFKQEINNKKAMVFVTKILDVKFYLKLTTMSRLLNNCIIHKIHATSKMSYCVKNHYHKNNVPINNGQIHNKMVINE
jgi:hypothetical protein